VVHAVQAQGLLHGYTTVFWWCVGLFVAAAVICGTLMRPGALYLKPGGPGAAAPGAGRPGAAVAAEGEGAKLTS